MFLCQWRETPIWSIALRTLCDGVRRSFGASILFFALCQYLKVIKGHRDSSSGKYFLYFYLFSLHKLWVDTRILQSLICLTADRELQWAPPSSPSYRFPRLANHPGPVCCLANDPGRPLFRICCTYSLLFIHTSWLIVYIKCSAYPLRNISTNSSLA